MTASSLALVILTPFVVIFVYSGWHEWKRARDSDGPDNYGLAYDPETDSTHVTLLDEGETGYDPETDRPESEAGADEPKA
ncbi:MAG: hypothetical protein U5K36_01330 [Roseovarius sp.]|nr:hypothetical protein [Roseovarius sp.]